MTRRVYCAPCDPDGHGIMCARKACLCGHPECWAYDSWRPVRREPRLYPDPRSSTP